MKLRRLVSLTGLAACAAISGPASGAPAPPGVQFLPDSTVLMRVGSRSTTAIDFVNAYYESWPAYRPAADSAGRVVFLDQLLDKEVLATVAVRVNPPLGFEDYRCLARCEPAGPRVLRAAQGVRATGGLFAQG